MIWLRLRKLERKLAKRELSEHTTFQYLITYLVVLITLAALPEITPYSSWNWDISHFIITLVITIAATFTAFRSNKKGDNRDFLKRFLSLSFVIGIWVVMGVLILRLAYKITLFVIPLDLFNVISNVITADLFQWLSNITGIIIFYLLLLRSFKNIQEIVDIRREEITVHNKNGEEIIHPNINKNE